VVNRGIAAALVVSGSVLLLALQPAPAAGDEAVRSTGQFELESRIDLGRGFRLTKLRVCLDGETIFDGGDLYDLSRHGLRGDSTATLYKGEATEGAHVLSLFAKLDGRGPGRRGDLRWEVYSSHDVNIDARKPVHLHLWFYREMHRRLAARPTLGFFAPRPDGRFPTRKPRPSPHTAQTRDPVGLCEG